MVCNMQHKNRMELLSPAGSLECGIAGIQYGADALYLGMPRFSARADATNFSLEELAVLTGIAHSATPRRKIYVTVNTLLRQDEIAEVVAMLGELNDAGIDGIIVQDALLAGIVRKYFPNLAIHASTQMAIHNLEGARQAKAMGFSRVVLARELSIEEIADIVKHSGIEIEVFIHGALCYSYSGLCLLSAAINGNSGNRGSCSYICRNKFKIQDATGKTIDTCCPMSMKDLALPDMLPQLQKAGVVSLKIEGRKKTPLYVAAVTNYYRKLLDGTFKGAEQSEAELDIKTIFSRPWTKFFNQNLLAAGITDTKHLGPRGIDVGCVNRVRNVDNGIHRVRFVVKNRPIEKHDGLQVELPDTEKPYGFPVTELLGFTQAGQDKWTQLYEAPIGTTVEVPLPPGHPELPTGARIYCTSSQAVKRKYEWTEPRAALCKRRTPVTIGLDVNGSGIVARATCDNVTVELKESADLQPAQKPERVEESAKQAFAKLGDTDYTLYKLEYRNDGAFFLPMSLMNDVRRRLIESLDAKRKEVRQIYVDSVLAEIAPQECPKSDTIKTSIKIDQPFQLNMLSDDDIAAMHEIVFAVGKTHPSALKETLAHLAARIPKYKIRIALPTISRPNVTPYQWQTMLIDLRNAGWTRYEVGNIGAFSVVSGKTCDITADWTLYTMNTVAAATWEKLGIKAMTVCPEDMEDNTMELLRFLGEKLRVVVYQNTVLARSAVCIMKSVAGFCPGKANCKFQRPLTLTRADGVQLTAVNDNCTTTLLQTPPRDEIARIPMWIQNGARHFVMDFTGVDNAPVAVKNVWEKVREEMKC